MLTYSMTINKDQKNNGQNMYAEFNQICNV